MVERLPLVCALPRWRACGARPGAVLLRGDRVRAAHPTDGSAHLHRAAGPDAGGGSVHLRLLEPPRLRDPPASPRPRGLLALPAGEQARKRTVGGKRRLNKGYSVCITLRTWMPYAL